MARLAAVEKGEYYPTPLTIVDTIAQAIDVQEGRGVFHLLDPCAGEGLALAHLAASIRKKAGCPVQTWGVEISPDRARQAAKRLDTVIEAPFEATTWSPSAISRRSLSSPERAPRRKRQRRPPGTGFLPPRHRLAGQRGPPDHGRALAAGPAAPAPRVVVSVKDRAHASPAGAPV